MSTKKILVINGSYRDDGITDQAVAVVLQELKVAGAETEVVNLREHLLEFCHNCRECTQQPGEMPGKCVIDDGMNELIERIEAANAYVLAAPTNFGTVTAVFKRFMERLVTYTYWPWDKPYPKFRKAKAVKKEAMLISSSAAPGLLGRWMYGSTRQLKMTAKTIGAEPVGILFTGLISKEKHKRLPQQAADRAKRIAARLIAA
jgi:multimeric flavodoxin WrbA